MKKKSARERPPTGFSSASTNRGAAIYAKTSVAKNIARGGAAELGLCQWVL